MAKTKTEWMKMAPNGYWDEHIVCHGGLLKVADKCGWLGEASIAERIRVHWEDNGTGECKINKVNNGLIPACTACKNA